MHLAAGACPQPRNALFSGTAQRKGIMVQDALTVGEKLLQLVIAGRDVPDPVQLTAALRRMCFRARKEIDEYMAAATRFREREGVVKECDEVRRRQCLIDCTAPGNITRVMRLHLRQEAASSFRLRPIRTDQ